MGLKKRIIPVLLLSGDRLVKTVGFEGGRVVGRPTRNAQVLSHQRADELVLLDITEELDDSRESLRNVIAELATVCFVPLAVGGGIRSVEDAELIFKSGGDKVVVNSALYSNPSIIDDIARRYGAQSLVASVDFRMSVDRPVCVSNRGRDIEGVSFEDHLRFLNEANIGEVLLQSVDRDGQREGLDSHVAKLARSLLRHPLILGGGVGTLEHLREAFLDLGADAVAVGSLFNFSDVNPIRANAYLRQHGVPTTVV
jgi:cyclase